MRVIVVKMREQGVEVPRRMLNDRYTSKYRGMLVIKDVTDQGLRRPAKVARLIGSTMPPAELVDPHIVWASDGRFTLAGFERGKNERGEAVDYAQSWLCAIDLSPVEAVESDGPIRGARPQR